MTVGAKANEIMSVATGKTLVITARASRVLREAGRDRWPQSPRGGGKAAAHVEAHHLTNLFLALMAADPITEAPKTVEEYRKLFPEQRRLETEEETGLDTKRHVSTHATRAGTYHLLSGIQEPNSPEPPANASFGLALDNLVRAACEPKWRNNPGSFEKWVERVTIWRSEPRAEIAFRTASGQVGIEIFLPKREMKLPFLSQDPTEQRPVAQITETASISGRIFEVMAEMVLDSERVRGLEKGNAGTVGTIPASVLSQPGTNPVNVFQCMLKDSDLEEREQGAPSSEPHGSPSPSGPDHQSKDEPSWKISSTSA
jgi:hypothetical protein